MIRKLYPGGKKKAFSITYDDGITQDIRFVELLNQYGLKGTFNLNSELMKNGFEWTHESGLVIKRLSPEMVVDLYQGHEVASHTLTHPYMSDLSEEELALCQIVGHSYGLDTENMWEKMEGFLV